MNWYKEKMEFHKLQWELAHDGGKDKAAAYHKQEFLNYQEMYKQAIKGGPENGG